jgi:threonine dehydrogenase-like Zn-dependent dehydrogenase
VNDRATDPAGATAAPELPATQHAIRFTGPGQLVHDRAKPVLPPGPTQVLARVEAVGICFSDTKLFHAWTAHPRKGEILGGLTPAELAEMPNYVAGERPTVPGHEAVCRIVQVGRDVRHHRVGERCLVQTDYRHLPTRGSCAAFGYTFEGGLQEYVLMDERVIIEPGTGERFLIPVGEGPGSSSVALLEPWACVEASYRSPERRTLRRGGRLLVVVEPGHAIGGLGELAAEAPPADVTAVVADPAQRVAIEAALPGVAPAFADGIDALPHGSFDDIVLFGSDGASIERLQGLLALGGVIDLVLGGRTIGRPVAVDVGGIHYDLTRWVGTVGTSAVDGYRMAPGDGELRAGDRVAVIGAAGPMGVMHVIRTAASGLGGLELVAIDIDAERLAHLEGLAGPLAASCGVRARFVDGRSATVEPGFSYVAVMVPVPALAVQAVGLAAPGARVNLFAGFASGTLVPLDLDALVAKGIYLFGTSGSGIADMRVVLAKLERGELDTDLSVDAVTGMEGVRDALAAVEARTSGGKIVVYPQLHETGMVRLADLGGRYPDVAARLRDGRWNRAAEEAFLETAGAAPAGR